MALTIELPLVIIDKKLNHLDKEREINKVTKYPYKKTPFCHVER